MYVLGLNAGNRLPSEDALPGWSNHDGAAVLLKDGIIVAAIEEERLDRIKHSNHFPHQAIKACLDQAMIRADQLDIIAVNFEGVGTQAANGAVGTLSALFQKYVGDVSRAKLRFVNHQLAHLFSAYVPSGFDECLCLSIDGLGDQASAAIGRARNGEIEVIRTLPADQSMGDFYCDAIRVLGYNRFDEYKVMALAALGDQRTYREFFWSLCALDRAGGYTLVGEPSRSRAFAECGIAFRREGADAPFTQAHCDFAAALQSMVADVVTHLVSHYREVTGATKIAMAGGVMHNCAVNGRLLSSGLFDHVFVQPAAHDAGGALGAAYAASSQAHRQAGMQAAASTGSFQLSLGRPLPDRGEIAARLACWSSFIVVEMADDPLGLVAAALSEGEVIGWVQGRSEFGPRALGNRSILADPRRVATRERINRDIKRREAFRPFAPAVLREEIWSVFAQPAGHANLDHMTFLLKFLPETEREYAAVAHADGSARVQTVSREANPRFHALIERFRALTGVPLLLNTSFNARGEPIVDSIEDAVATFLLTGLDLLVVDDFIVRAVPGALTGPPFDGLRVTLPLSRKIVFRATPGTTKGQHSYFLETTFSRHFGGGRLAIPDAVASLLLASNGSAQLASLRQRTGSDDDADSIRRELIALWRAGHVRLRP